MRTILVILCLSLTSCESLWMSWYRHQGGYNQRPSSPTAKEAAENLMPHPGSSQPTHY
jgi:hypothetical protein